MGEDYLVNQERLHGVAGRRVLRLGVRDNLNRHVQVRLHNPLSRLKSCRNRKGHMADTARRRLRLSQLVPCSCCGLALENPSAILLSSVDTILVCALNMSTPRPQQGLLHGQPAAPWRRRICGRCRPHVPAPAPTRSTSLTVRETTSVWYFLVAQ